MLALILSPRTVPNVSVYGQLQQLHGDYFVWILKQWGSKCSLLVLDWLLSIASPLRFALARKIWRQILEGFLAPFFMQTMRDRNLHSSFVISF